MMFWPRVTADGVKMTNGTVKRILVAAALTASTLLFGAGGRSVFSKVKVDVRLEKPPVPSVNNSPQSAQRIVPDPQWLMVRVTFVPQIPRAEGPNYKTYIDGVLAKLIESGAIEKYIVEAQELAGMDE